jgi:hypothetical protein
MITGGVGIVGSSNDNNNRAALVMMSTRRNSRDSRGQVGVGDCGEEAHEASAAKVYLWTVGIASKRIFQLSLSGDVSLKAP